MSTQGITFIPRLLEDITDDIDSDHSATTSERNAAEITAFFGNHTFVVLGEPGAGKSTLFQHAATLEGGQYFPIRTFLRQPTIQLNDRIYYLDALDEMRFNRDSQTANSAIDQIVHKLLDLQRPKVRLSCRAADWFGQLDLSAIQEAAVGPVRVLMLLPLDRDAQEKMVSAKGLSPNAFLQRAGELGIDSWVGNPQSLSLLTDAVRGGGWPASRAELFQSACQVLATEQNPQHKHASTFSSGEILNSAGKIFAVQLLSRVDGFSLDPNMADADFPDLALFGSGGAEATAARRRFFSNTGPGRITVIHRQIAEYLAARYIISQIGSGLPANRVATLITASDGGIPTDLRGLFGWLTCLLPFRTTLFCGKDPIASIIYGDLGLLPPIERWNRFEVLANHVRMEHFETLRRSRALDSLADRRLAMKIRGFLNDPNSKMMPRSLILEALARQPFIDELYDTLFNLTTNPSCPPAESYPAVRVLLHYYPGSTDVFMTLLNLVNQGNIPDTADELRTLLLTRLYPEIIATQELLEYIPKFRSRTLGTFYADYLPRKLPLAVPISDLPNLLDHLSTRATKEDVDLLNPSHRRHQVEPEADADFDSRIDQIQLIDFAIPTLLRALEVNGTDKDPSRVYRWLQLISPHDSRYIFSDDLKTCCRKIADWLYSNPDYFFKLFLAAIESHSSQIPSNEVNFSSLPFEFYRRTLGVRPPGYLRFLLSLIPGTQQNRLSEAIFRHAFQIGTHTSGAEVADISAYSSLAQTVSVYRRLLSLRRPADLGLVPAP